ncbi:MAG: hypothetical protein E5X35_11680 [Mesorhizobium sp.]|nr:MULTISPECIES: hypothetical protein [unclassified Mesorhizobium]RUV65191.1 hypothetical protein EOA85_00060 [Mesorhizobium sp. M5C.F.Ca.IN.020.29.1.1]TIR33318.1 MAG: hypothetical protein E5X35_11680 [Mesorhizobium sp.]
MAKFRKGDRVSIQGVIAGDYVHEGKIKVQVEPYHDIFVEMSDVTMVRPNILVGDTVWCPEKGHAHATVLAIGEEHLWVSFGDGNYATWWAPQVQRIDPEAVPAEPEPPPIAPDPIPY